LDVAVLMTSQSPASMRPSPLKRIGVCAERFYRGRPHIQFQHCPKAFNTARQPKQSGDKVAEVPMPSEGKKLFRSKKNRVLAGVCGGIAEYLGVDPTIVRLLWVLFTLLYGVGLLGYIIAILIIPQEP